MTVTFFKKNMWLKRNGITYLQEKSYNKVLVYKKKILIN